MAHKYKFILCLNIFAIMAGSTIALGSLHLNNNVTHTQLSNTKQTSLKTSMENISSYPEIRNTDFIDSLIVDKEINREKLSAYFKLLNMPPDATFNLIFVKTFPDGLINFTLGITPWINDTGVQVNDDELQLQLSIQLLPENWQPIKKDYLWLWILIGVLSGAVLIFILFVIMQYRKDKKLFPYKI